MDLGIKNRTAIISGADSGIGLETARMLHAEGVKIAVTDIDQGRLDEAAKKIGDEVVAVAADLTKQDDVDHLRNEVNRQLGQSPDILVHCAGVTGATGLFDEIDMDGWYDTMDINFYSAVRMTRAFAPAMKERGWGRIVLTASEDAVQPYVEELPYCASKAAVLSLTKGLSKYYGKSGVLVNAVSPAFIATPMTDVMMAKRADEKGVSLDEAIDSFLDEERPFMELHRRGKAEEVASVYTFLCSEQASFVNGSNYRVDSGSVATI